MTGSYRATSPALGVTLAKYNPAQPRVPAGNGRESGRLVVSFLAGASPGVVRALTAFAARFTVPTAVLGALFIPTPNTGGVIEGTLPGAPDIRFRLDGPAGLLRLARTLADGSEAGVVAHSRLGVFFSGDTALGRALGTQLYLDLATVTVTALMAPDERDKPQAATDEPQLCPAPEADVKNRLTEHVRDYEDDVHARLNPIAPIPRGFAVRIIDPRTGEAQFPDDCFRYAGDLVDGDMRAGDFADAKSEEYSHLLTQSFGAGVMEELVDTTKRHLRAAEARGAGLKVYFAEKDAADRAREAFAEEGLAGVAVGFLPPSRPKQGGRRR